MCRNPVENFQMSKMRIFEILVLNFAFFLFISVPQQQAPWWSYAKFEVIFAVNHRNGKFKIGLFGLFGATKTSSFISNMPKRPKSPKYSDFLLFFLKNQLFLTWALSCLNRPFGLAGLFQTSTKISLAYLNNYGILISVLCY